MLIYDFDNYYLGGVIAEYLAIQGLDVAYATPAGHASAWTIMTNEQPFVHQALHKHNVSINTQSLLSRFDGEQAMLNNIFTGEEQMLAVRSVIIVGLRLPNDKLFQNVMSRSEEFADFGIKSVDRIGDVLAAAGALHRAAGCILWNRLIVLVLTLGGLAVSALHPTNRSSASPARDSR